MIRLDESFPKSYHLLILVQYNPVFEASRDIILKGDFRPFFDEKLLKFALFSDFWPKKWSKTQLFVTPQKQGYTGPKLANDSSLKSSHQDESYMSNAQKSSIFQNSTHTIPWSCKKSGNSAWSARTLKY